MQAAGQPSRCSTRLMSELVRRPARPRPRPSACLHFRHLLASELGLILILLLLLLFLLLLLLLSSSAWSLPHWSARPMYYWLFGMQLAAGQCRTHSGFPADDHPNQKNLLHYKGPKASISRGLGGIRCHQNSLDHDCDYARVFNLYPFGARPLTSRIKTCAATLHICTCVLFLTGAGNGDMPRLFVSRRIDERRMNLRRGSGKMGKMGHFGHSADIFLGALALFLTPGCVA